MAGIRNDVIDTGYIPVEYNMYIELTEKAEKYDRMMGALKEYNNKHKNSISDGRTSYQNYYDRRSSHIFESTQNEGVDAFYRLCDEAFSSNKKDYEEFRKWFDDELENKGFVSYNEIIEGKWRNKEETK